MRNYRVREYWLLDSGASCHMTNVISLVHDIENIKPIHMVLPKGSRTLTIKRGNASIDSRLKLNNVLFIPVLSCNLISITQLVEDNICEVTFNKKLCVIWDLTTMSQIGVLCDIDMP